MGKDLMERPIDCLDFWRRLNPEYRGKGFPAMVINGEGFGFSAKAEVTGHKILIEFLRKAFHFQTSLVTL
jgi:hypothetical protein